MDSVIRTAIDAELERGFATTFDPENSLAIKQAFIGAEREGIAPQLFRYAREQSWEIEPPLRTLWIEHITRVALYRKLSAEVESALTLPYLVLKGEPLANYLFDDAFARTITDLDLLVKPGDVHHAIELLGAVGFRQIEGHAVRPWAYNQVALRHVKHGAVLELHWRLALPYIPSPAAQEILSAIDPEKGRFLRGSFLAIHLAFHLFQHHGFTKGVFDFAALAPKLKVEEFRAADELAKRLGVQTIFGGAVELARRIGVDTPVSVSPSSSKLADLFTRPDGFLVEHPNTASDFFHDVALCRFLDRPQTAIKSGLRPILFGPHRIGTFLGSRFGREWW